MPGNERCLENGFHVQKFGNGTTALIAALKTLDCRQHLIAVPAPACPNVAAAVLASGNVPFFVDIERQRYGLDPDTLEKILPRVRAVIAVHAFGIPCEIGRIQRLCRERGVPLIEDCAPSEGARIDGEPVGRFGDIAIFSFGAGKIIDAGGGGLAVTPHPELAERLQREYDALPAETDRTAGRELGAFFKFLYNQMYPDRLSFYRNMFTQLLEQFGQRLRSRFDPGLESPVQQARQDLPHNIDQRWRKVELYRKCLADESGVTLLSLPEGTAPWRFNVWVDNRKRDFILRTLIREDVNVSSWYPDISQFLNCDPAHATALDNSRWLESGILNFWVDAATSHEAIRRTCDRFLALLNSETN